MISGTIRIDGVAGDSLKELKLEVFEGSVKKATGVLTNEATSALIGHSFTADGVKITTPTALFLIPSAELAAVNQSTNGSLVLRVSGTTTQGRVTPVRESTVTKLVWYTGNNRYGDGRDWDNCTFASVTVACGGDGWALPLTVSRSAAVSGVAFGDFSNMNGGYFPNHTSHTDGDDVDVKWWAGGTAIPHFAVNRNTAERLVQLFQNHDASIDFVYVTFTVSQPNATIEFWEAIRNAEVNGSRLIPEHVALDAENRGNSEVQRRERWRIRNEGRVRFRHLHDTHFHIRWRR